MTLRNVILEDRSDLGYRYGAHDSVGDGAALAREKHAPRENAYFDVYCAEWVSFTSVHSGGGDWHWRLISAGRVLLDCGGYKSRAACAQAVETLRREAWTAEFPQ
jgi:uncharacterized protein YegP (UPF0339 family)